ncbi:hypothetical protein AVEN_93127-1 [Araneus ventricosus]|uniref:Uncharacterized protein n=1 Tax=Araneus ventricosus TaxID=182803 RepID=A0A4Y1ZN09_ARAVE|nr:hypothetical protein AVEN_93127-1 [Araneus ventricosus]
MSPQSTVVKRQQRSHQLDRWFESDSRSCRYINVRFKAAYEGAVGDGPRNFEPRSDDSTTPELAPPLLQTSCHQWEDVWPPRSLALSRPHAADLQ